MVLLLLNREETPRRLDADPNLTTLEYLRGQGLVGTKEGCASGDCGACAVATATEDGQGGLHYETVNSCICPVAALHRRHVITVEGLADSDERLHPVQQAMVDANGSQCGFCTPGFVMSLFVHGKNNGDLSHESLCTRLSGNLCRCTGYRPILDAARRAARRRAKDWFDRQQQQTAHRLKGLRRAVADKSPRYYAPRTLAKLADLLVNNPHTRILAGGTDMTLELTQQLRPFHSLAYVGDIAAMSAIRENRREWIIGGAASYADIMQTVAAHPRMDDLRAMLSRFGSPQIRARATIGGNLANASPVADGPPAWLALEATLVLRRGSSTRQLPLEKFYRAYKKTALRQGEFIERVIVPKPGAADVFRMYKVSKRMDDDISSVCAAFKFTDERGAVRNPRIAFGGMAAMPLRARRCERAWAGATRQDESALQAALKALATDFRPISDARAGAAYRVTVAANLLRKAHGDSPPEFPHAWLLSSER